jgi:polysaccharide biosynthesis/export protein
VTVACRSCCERARVLSTLLAIAIAATLTGCAAVPSSGPTAHEVRHGAAETAAIAQAIQIIDLNDAIARQLAGERQQRLFSEVFAGDGAATLRLGPGDTVGVDIWEAPPATLFGAQPPSTDTGSLAASHTGSETTIPDQMIDEDGYIDVPFAGRVSAAGKTVAELEQDITQRLTEKAHQPQVLVRVTQNVSRSVTVVGEVNNTLRVPLTANHERLLDALAATGGFKYPVNKTTIQLTRGTHVQALPLDTIIRDPRQNIPLQTRDVLTAIFAPLSFTALGTTGKNDEINFEAQGITLAQALARAGALVDSQADPRGLFIFRFEQSNALTWPKQPVTTTPDGLVPVIYRINLKDPGSFFVMQSFAMNNRDILYVSDAPVTEVQKFMNLIFSIVFPILNAKQTLGF